MVDDNTFTFTPSKRPVGRPAATKTPANVSTAPAKKTDGDTVTRALASMNAIYGTVGVALMLTGYEKTADDLADRKDRLEEANREAFTASPKLAELIAGAAPVAAVSAFFVAHVTTGIALAGTLREERREKLGDSGDGTTATDVG